MKTYQQLLVVIGLIFGSASPVISEPVKEIWSKERCKVCGMFVAKYKLWLAQIQHKDGTTSMFDGVKDMMAYFHEPVKYGGGEDIVDIYVKDYYTQNWLDGRSAFYVIGSDVLGPMGHEFIPFSSEDSAKNFKKDHDGKNIIRFEEITLERVNELRTKMLRKKMRKLKKKN